MIEILIILVLLIAIIYYVYTRYKTAAVPPVAGKPVSLYTSIAGWVFPYNDIMVNDKMVTNGLDAEGCANLCKSTPTCVATSYNTENTACWLKSKLTNGHRMPAETTQVMSGYEIPKETNEDYYKSIM